MIHINTVQTTGSPQATSGAHTEPIWAATGGEILAQFQYQAPFMSGIHLCLKKILLCTANPAVLSCILIAFYTY